MIAKNINSLTKIIFICECSKIYCMQRDKRYNAYNYKEVSFPYFYCA